MASPLRFCHLPESPSPVPASLPPTHPLILSLPSEVLDQILDYLEPSELTVLASTCHRFHGLASRDGRWESFLATTLPTPLTSPGPLESYKALYAAHGDHWFLPHHKLWFSDAWPHGKLLLARYDPRSGCIEAYALAAKAQGFRSIHVLEWERDVVYRSFDPIVQLDLNQPVVRLTSTSPNVVTETIPNRNSSLEHQKWRPERPMSIPSSLHSYSDHLVRDFLHTRNLPSHLLDRRTALWPPLTIPSPGNTRTRATSNDSYSSTGHKPSLPSESSTTTFRIRQSLNFNPFNALQPLISFAANRTGSLPGDKVDTYGTLDPRAYMPTNEKPYQGIFVGDYSTHGCEFLLITQPDVSEARPLSRKARLALERWPHATQWQALLAEAPGEEDVYDDDVDLADDENAPEYSYETSLSAAMQLRRQRQRRGEDMPDVLPGAKPEERKRAHKEAAAFVEAGVTRDRKLIKDEPPFKGRLEAIKLTGDPNVPRGEVTFIADDLGEKGLVGHTKAKDFFAGQDAAEGKLSASLIRKVKKGVSPLTGEGHVEAEKEQRQWKGGDTDKEDEFKGTRFVRSIGHVCETTPARRESYIPTQLLLISPDRIAQWWMPYQHVSFYQRVDWEQFLKV